MAREHGASAKPWGTLEELLLACAVNRHGTTSWDSIAGELQNRSSSVPSLLPLTLTPQYCRDKFDDLKRRFMPPNGDESASLVDELRRIRVEELRREVQRRDVSIVSLELKVKRLEQERERSLKDEAEAVDLKKDLEGDGQETTQSPEKLAGKSVSGDVSDDKENRSFNESNSTSQRGDGQVPANGVVGDQVRPEPEGNEPDPGQSGSAHVKESSYDNDKVEHIDEDAGGEEEVGAKSSRAGGPGESNERLESVGESKREKEAASRQSSDVQSSASLSMKKRLRRGGEEVSSGEEPEGDEVSPARRRVSAVKSEPLVKLLGIIRSHRLSSVFERRLRSQESERYKSWIRQHLDLQTVQSRLDRGVYEDCVQKFFRDLLLLFNNGVVFFRKSSSEHVAARELRAIVRKELNHRLRKPQSRTVKSEPSREPDTISKPSKQSSMVVCGKRSSMKTLIAEGAHRKVEKREKEVEEKPDVSRKKNDASFVKIEEKGIRKKRTKEILGRRSSRTSNKGGEMKHEYGVNELSSHDSMEVKMDKKENTVKKKQGAASFLKRMKQNSSSEVLEDADDSDEDSKESRSEKEKKRRGRKREGIKREERVTRSSTGGRGGREENSAKVKRGVGRPPKRPESVATAAVGRRGRDNGEADGVGGAGRSRKRSRS